jgi:hypothetical protein
MTEDELHQTIAAAKKALGPSSRKFSGTVTTELIRQALLDSGIPVSSRDVFVRGLSLEIDLLILSKGAKPRFEVLYEPSDVLACLEVKNAGSFGESTIQGTKTAFARARAAIPDAQCFYVSLSERSGFRGAVTDANVAARAFTLFEYSGSGKRYRLWPTGDWPKLQRVLQDLVAKGKPLPPNHTLERDAPQAARSSM